MLKVKFGKGYYEQINYFLEGYKKSFKKLYTDTGIDNEYFFHQGYIKNAKDIKNEIKKETIIILQEEIVAYKLYENGEKSIKIYLKSFMLEIFFEEDIEEKIRFIDEVPLEGKKL